MAARLQMRRGKRNIPIWQGSKKDIVALATRYVVSLLLQQHCKYEAETQQM